MTCLVSVIMPVYMAQDYVEAAILSLENQTYQNLEILCVDDASSDHSYAICERLAARYSNIRLLKNMTGGCVATHNLGQEVTRNTGLEAATGKYCIFLDSDDTLSSETIEEMVAAAESSEANIVMCGYSEIVSGRDNPRLANIDGGLQSMQKVSENLLDNVPWDIISCIGNKLYRMDYIRNTGLRFDRKYKYNEDAAFALSAFLHTDSIYYINIPFYKYLIRTSDSTMSSYRNDMFLTNIKVVELARELLERYSCFAEKRLEYYRKIYYLMISSLINEISFAGKKEYYRVCGQIRDHESFGCVRETVKDTLPLYHRILFSMLNHKQYGLLYIVLKLRGALTDAKRAGLSN